MRALILAGLAAALATNVSAQTHLPTHRAPSPASAAHSAPKPIPKPATRVVAPPSPEKMAISKACSDQANAKNLHGKAREKFRSECKRRGGKG